MTRKLALMALLMLARGGWAEQRYEITLPHLALRWSMQEGLSVEADGIALLTLPVAPVVAHPAGWAWSYTGREGIEARLKREGGRQILIVTCADPKVPWSQTIVAGPGDKYTLTYRFRQLAWEEKDMQYEICAAQLAPLLIGASWKAKGKAGEKSGVIPLQFGGVAHPFAEATHGEFGLLPGRLAFQATEPLTLYDYEHRRHFWLGRDGPMPKGVEQSWSVEFRFAPEPFVVGGVELTQVRVPRQARGQKAELQLNVRRKEGGPATITVAWGERTEGAVPIQQAVALSDKPQALRLAYPLREPGTYALGFSVQAGEKTLYMSPIFAVTLPRLVTVKPARIPFTPQDKGALLVWVDKQAGEGVTLSVEGVGQQLYSGAVKGGDWQALPLPLTGLPLGRTELTVTLAKGGEKLFQTTGTLWIAAGPPANGVVIDNRSRALIVEGLPFCAQSCYTDVRHVEEVIETEAVWGFNTVAPYLPTDIRQRDRAWIRRLMDRCAEVGLKVHLDIRAASHPPHTEEKWRWLQEEIEAVRDHPALLSYYLADEPELGWAKPEDCELAYNKIKALDPWHPVTMVFCVPSAAARYAKGMDICMTDPYPIPNGPVTNVVDYCRRIDGDLGQLLPLWVVPQAFGGGEGWAREPSRQEERVMTYLALIQGATGIQYFIRRPPAVNPNSPDLWSECRRLMLELSQLTPALAGERLFALPADQERTEARVSPESVQVAVFRERGAITILCANTRNEPAALSLTLPGHWTGEAEVLFENRRVPVREGRLEEMIDAFGTRVYRLQVEPPPPDIASLHPRNLISNPSWEKAANVGTPDGCYIGYGEDKAASWYVDPRTAVHGRQSLRLRTPKEGQGISVSPYPIKLTPGQRYVMSVWAKGERAGMKFSLTLDAVRAAQGTHELTTEWREYRVEFTATEAAKNRLSPCLRLISAGSAWFDALQVFPVQ